MRSIQIGTPKPRQGQIHDEHMAKEYQSRPLVNSRMDNLSHASASTQDLTGRAEQKLPHRTHLLSEGAMSARHAAAINVVLRSAMNGLSEAYRTDVCVSLHRLQKKS